MNSKAQSLPDKIFNIINYTVLTLVFIVCMYPFYYILIYSVSSSSEAQKGITLLPRGLTLSNYISVFQLEGIAQAAVVSLLRTVLGTAITVVCCALFAYLVTKEVMYFRKAIYRFLVVTMYFSSGLIPWYLTMRWYHLNDNFLIYILPGAVSAYYIVLLKTFIEQLPPSLEESARLDGAGYLTIFSKIIFPLSKPIVATIAVFAAVGQWNSWFDNYILVQKPSLNTLQLILYNYLNQATALANAANELKMHSHATMVTQVSPQTIKMTITMVVTLPILFVYPFMQRYFVKGIMLGAIKG